MPYTTPIFGLQAPLEEELAYLAPSQLQAMVNRLEAVLKDRAAVPGLADLNAVVARLQSLEADRTAAAGPWTSFTPQWAASAGAPAVGNGTLTGKYRKTGRMVEVNIYCALGSTSSGGAGGWQFSLPFIAAAGREHFLTAKCYVSNGANHMGYGLIPASTAVVTPWMPVSRTDSNMQQVQNGAGNGTGVPSTGTGYSFANGSNMSLFGTYESVN